MWAFKEFWGCSSVGSAPALQAGGRQFEPDQLHQNKNGRYHKMPFLFFFRDTCPPKKFFINNIDTKHNLSIIFQLRQKHEQLFAHWCARIL